MEGEAKARRRCTRLGKRKQHRPARRKTDREQAPVGAQRQRRGLLGRRDDNSLGLKLSRDAGAAEDVDSVTPLGRRTSPSFEHCEHQAVLAERVRRAPHPRRRLAQVVLPAPRKDVLLQRKGAAVKRKNLDRAEQRRGRRERFAASARGGVQNLK